MLRHTGLSIIQLSPVQKKDTRLRENITDIAPKSFNKNNFLFILNLEYGYHTCMLFTLLRYNKNDTTVLKSNRYPNLHIHDLSLSWIFTGISITRLSRSKTNFMAQTTNRGEMKGSCMWYPHASEMLTLTHNGANSVEVKIAIILNIIHHTIFNLRDTEVAID